MDRIEKIITKASYGQLGLKVSIHPNDGVYFATYKDDEFKGEQITDSLYVNNDELDKINKIRKKIRV